MRIQNSYSNSRLMFGHLKRSIPRTAHLVAFCVTLFVVAMVTAVGADNVPRDVLGLRRVSTLTPMDGGRFVVFDENIVERDRPNVLSDDVQAALDWLDQYSSRQVLFQKQDMRTLQSAIARMSPVEFTKWLDDSRQLRTRLDSDEWRITRAWFSEFLSVQVNYSESEIDAFRQHMAQLSAEQLMEVLDHLQQEHLHRIRGRIASQQHRQQLLATNRNHRGGSGYASGARFAPNGTGRYFGGSGQSARATLRRQRYSPPSGQGLSLRVAKRYIYRAAFGGRFIYGW